MEKHQDYSEGATVQDYSEEADLSCLLLCKFSAVEQLPSIYIGRCKRRQSFLRQKDGVREPCSRHREVRRGWSRIAAHSPFELK